MGSVSGKNRVSKSETIKIIHPRKARTVGSKLGTAQAVRRSSRRANTAQVSSDDRVRASTHVLLTLAMRLQALEVAIRAVVHCKVNLGLRKRRVRLACRFGNHV